jgi:hypothetical protein
MRRSLIALILGLFVVIPLTSSASAAPAESYSDSACDAYTAEDGNAYEYCASFRGVYQSAEMPNDMFRFTDNGTASSSAYINGELYESSDVRFTRTGLSRERGGVFHEAIRGTHSFAVAPHQVVACIYEVNFIYAHFDVRHSVSIQGCA